MLQAVGMFKCVQRLWEATPKYVGPSQFSSCTERAGRSRRRHHELSNYVRSMRTRWGEFKESVFQSSQHVHRCLYFHAIAKTLSALAGSDSCAQNNTSRGRCLQHAQVCSNVCLPSRLSRLPALHTHISCDMRPQATCRLAACMQVVDSASSERNCVKDAAQE